MTPSNGLGEMITFKLPYGEADLIAKKLIGVLQGTPLGLGIVGLQLAIARLSQGEDELTVDEEVKFIQDLSSYIGAYWGDE